MWSRVTLVAEQRRVDAVLPATEPIGTLMPEVLRLLDDPVRHPAQLRHLVTSTGEVLDGQATLAERGVLDGSVLRLVRADEPLPAPVVHDVPEAVDDAVADHLWRWSPRAAQWTATVATAVLTAAGGLVLRTNPGGAAGFAAAATLAVLLTVAGLAISALGRTRLGAAVTLGGGALAGVAVWHGADLYDWEPWIRWGSLGVLVGLLLAALGAATPLGRGGLVGGGLVALLAAMWGACTGLGLDAARTGAVLAVACVVLLNVMLRIALTLSGLTSLDDRRSAGSAVPRGDVLTALVHTHRSLVIATMAVAVAAVTAGWAPATRLDGWTAALAVLLAIVVASRARMFPLVPQKAVLLAAALAIWVNLAYRWADRTPWAAAPALGMLVAVLAIPLAVLTAEQPEHVRARLRRITGRAEAAAAVAIIPVALGVFGVYQRLLHTF